MEVTVVINVSRTVLMSVSYGSAKFQLAGVLSHWRKAGLIILELRFKQLQATDRLKRLTSSFGSTWIWYRLHFDFQPMASSIKLLKVPFIFMLINSEIYTNCSQCNKCVNWMCNRIYAEFHIVLVLYLNWKKLF